MKLITYMLKIKKKFKQDERSDDKFLNDKNN